nr:hypothetical protein [uncultured Faecalimonas sp.]
MNMLEFLANVVVEEGELDTALAMGGQYVFVIPKEDQFSYQHVILKPQNNNGFDEKFAVLQKLLRNCYENEKCRRIKMLLETEIKYKENMLSTIAEYPFYSIRGTCGRKCCSDACERIDFPCCKNKMIGYTGNVIYPDPEPIELLGSLLNWSFLCEDLDIVLILHDSYPDSMDDLTFATGYQLRNGVIKVLNETDAKTLYQEYSERYPFDISETERFLRYLHRK